MVSVNALGCPEPWSPVEGGKKELQITFLQGCNIIAINPSWMPCKQNKTRAFLEQLGKALIIPSIGRRQHLLHTEASEQQKGRSCDLPEDPAAPAAAPAGASKMKRFQICPAKKGCKTHTVCCRSKNYICKGCVLPYMYLLGI